MYEDYLVNRDLYDFTDIRDVVGYVTSLVIMFISGVELLKRFPDISLFDSIYKINIYNMSLFNCCEMSFRNKTFNWIVVFMNEETEKYYKNAIEFL